MFHLKITVVATFILTSSVVLATEGNWTSAPERIAPLQEINWQQMPSRQFAQVADTFSLADGEWRETGSQGLQEWRLRLRSVNAVNLNLGFAELQLPSSAKLTITGPGVDAELHGPYTANDIVDGVLFTPVVHGEELWLSLHVTSEQRAQVMWQRATLQHGFRSLDGRQVQQGIASQRATGCGTNTQCPQADPWRNQVNATVQLTVAGMTLCTGTLVTDTSQSLRPFILTADHCGSSTGPATDGGNSENPQAGPYFDTSDASSTVAYWGFEAFNCGSAASPPPTQSVSGAFLRSANAFIDFALIEMASSPPAAFNPYWSGWDARGTGSNSGVGIHHANGDEKEIAFYRSSLSKQSPVTPPYAAQDYWRVVWSQGVTAVGSSGSGIWDSLGRLVGSLSRGLSSCSNPSGADFYGAFDQAWNSNAQSNRQLAAWLDPSNSGVLAMDGRDLNTTAAPVTDSGAGSVPAQGGGGSSSGGGSGSGSSGGGGGGAFLYLVAMMLLGRLAAARSRG